MKAISFYQPYAWMMANGHLDIDDRTWGTDHRGEIAIHATRSFSQGYYDYIKDVLKIDIPEPEKLDFGSIIAIAEITNVLKPGEQTKVPVHRRAHGDANCYGWEFNNVRLIKPITFRGQQGIFEASIEHLIKSPKIKPMQPNLF